MPINRIINNSEKELVGGSRIIGNQEKELQRVVKIIGNQEKEVWSGNKVFLIGTGTSIDIKNRYQKYNELTANNFFVVGGNTASGSIYWEEIQLAYASGHFRKSYNNGVISQYMVADGGNSAWESGSYSQTKGTTMALCLKPEKLILIGSANGTYDIKSLFPNSYQNFTSNNFLMSLGNVDKNVGSAHKGTLSSRVVVSKSYNASTGQLSVSSFIDDTSGGNRLNFGNVYLFKGTPKNL